MLEIQDLSTLSTASIQASEQLLVSMLADLAPSLDTSPGSVLRQVLIGPAAQFHALTQANIDRVRQSGSLLRISQDPTLADTGVVDELLSNWKVTRQPGGFATGQVRLILTDNGFLTLPNTLVFTANGVPFSPTATFNAVPSADNVLGAADRLITPLGGDQYAVTIDVQAVTAGAAGNLTNGTPLDSAASLPGVTAILAAGDFDGGSDTETNQSMLDRLASGVSSQSLSCRLGAKARLQASFPAVVDVSVIGAGDPEMQRDRRSTLGFSGFGRCDIYARTRSWPLTTLITASGVLEDATAGTWSINFTREDAAGAYTADSVVNAATPSGATAGTLEILSLTRGVDTSDVPGVDYVPDILDTDAAFSRYQTLTLRFTDPDTANLTAGARRDYTVALTGMPEIDEISDYVLTRQNRPTTGDYLVKAPIPCRVAVELTVVKGPDNQPVDTGSIQVAVANAVNGLRFTDGQLPASLVIQAAWAVIPPKSRVKMPVALSGRVIAPDGGDDVWIYSANELVVPDLSARTISPRTVAFYLNPTDVQVNVLPSDHRPA